MNVSTSLEIVSAPLGEPLISDHITNYIMVMTSFVILIFSLPAVVLNNLNVYSFINTKLDSVTVCFISLALADMLSMILLSTNATFYLIHSSGVSWSRNLPTLTYFVSFLFILLMDMSSATTTYIAVQRGLCVTFPFYTRNVFNKNRSLVICSIISLVILVCTLPRFATFRLKTLLDPIDNTTTLLVFEYFESWYSFDSFYLIFMKSVLAFTEYGIMVVCTVAISIGMRSSLKLKQKSNTYSSKTSRGAHSKKGKEKKDLDDIKSSEKEQFQKKDSKESLVVKQSLIVVLIHVILTTPRIFVSLFKVFEPRFTLGGQYNNLFFVFFNSINVADSINAFVNFFVYLTFNSKFRHYFFHKIYRPVVKNGSSSILQTSCEIPYLQNTSK